MRDYGAVAGPTFWTDYLGQRWRVIRSRARLKFKYPAHRALRRHCFHRDGYACVKCGAKAVSSVDSYDGSDPLRTDTFVSSGWPDVLILDHRLTLAAGGASTIDNLQTICETCNKRKIPEDNRAAALFRRVA